MSDDDAVTVTELPVCGTIPSGLSGRYLRIGSTTAPAATAHRDRRGARVDAVAIQAGRAALHRNGRSVSDGSPAGVARQDRATATAASGDGSAAMLELGGRVLVLSDGEVARELGADLRSTRRVDLAGRGQGVGAHPTLDPVTGELHLLASPGQASAAHQVISHGAMTRRTRPLSDRPTPIHHLAVTTDRLVLFGQGAIGITSRTMTGAEGIRWVSTETIAGRDVGAVHDEGHSVVIYAIGRSLDRWTIEPERGSARLDVVDAMTPRFGCTNRDFTTSPIRYLYAVGSSGSRSGKASRLSKHDLLTGLCTSLDLGPHRSPGELLFVSDPQRARSEDGGWLVGLVHDDLTGRASLVVVDAGEPGLAVVATVRLPGPTPYGQRGLWSAC